MCRSGRHILQFRYWGFVLTALWLTACAGLRGEPTTFLSPTGAPQASPFSLPTTIPGTQVPTDVPPATPTAACSSNLVYLEDLTIPDGTEVAAGEVLDKRWRVENPGGACNWDASYGIQLSSGPDLGAPPNQALYPARSGGEAVIQMSLTAPEEPGTYNSAWQALDPEGNPFGDPIYIEIVVP
jgi:hypothetical protein